MIELRGKYNTAKVFTDVVDNSAIGQIVSMLNQEFIKESKVRIMPDCHAGAGCTIGTTMTIVDKVVPNLVGVDIGCFTGDTRVWCSAGYYKTIKELADLGHEFMTDSFDTSQKCFVTAKAIAIKTRSNAELVRVSYRRKSKLIKTNIESVRCTPDHKFLVQDEELNNLRWIEAKDLEQGDLLVAEDLEIEVTAVEKLTEREDVYCLNVPVYHNFAIELGVIVHNCGMLAIKLKENRINLPELDSVIRKYVPSGAEVHETPKPLRTSLDVEELRCFGVQNSPIREMYTYQSVGTLGGGNHFIEVDKDSKGNLWLVIHTGSRHLGLEVCNFYQDAGYNELKKNCNEKSRKELVDDLINRLKAEGRQKDIEKEVNKFNKSYKENKPSIPYELSYVEGKLFDDYIHDMAMVQEHAKCNREEIARVILKKAKLHEVDSFQTIHNYIDTENMILRKGAVSAGQGERLIIPINMRDGSLICVGKGNDDWNQSAPHGAGRLMSRSQAKESLTVSQFKKEMDGIYSTSVGRSTLDESPMAYKSMSDIVDNISNTVEIVDIIKPIYNFKAGDEE